MAKNDDKSAPSKASPQPEQPPQAPSAPEMRKAWEFFLAGDNRAARKEAKSVLSGQSSQAAQDEARELIRRTNLDPGALITIITMVVVILGILIALGLGHKLD
jgi:hypothetical protein